MRAVLTPEQVRSLEAFAINRGVPSLLLMEQAASAVAEALAARAGGAGGKRVLFVCGTGNNGGDGLAAARIFSRMGGLPTVILAGQTRTADAATNLRYATETGVPVLELEAGRPGSDLMEKTGKEPWDAVVDALLGTGLSRAPEGRVRDLVLLINGIEAPVVSVDIPSGMDGETGRVAGVCVKADITVTFAFPKPGLYLSAQRELAGEILVADIGIPPLLQQEFLSGCGWTPCTMLEEKDLLSRLPPRPLSAHKGTAGRVLLYAGSLGMAGAAAIAAKACLRAGAGLVSVVCDQPLIPILQTLVPAAVCVPLERALQQPPAHDVLAVGCGLGQGPDIWRNILALHRPETLSVWDADALNLLAGQPMPLGGRAVMTPHPGEAARLLSCSARDVTEALLLSAVKLQGKYGATVVCKSHCPVIAADGRTAISGAGTPALAKGGSGDTLTGIIAGLLAQLRDKPDACFEAARTACLWHGMAGRLAGRKAGVHSALATDVIDSMGEAAAFC